jgi:general secretion pathway protein D
MRLRVFFLVFALASALPGCARFVSPLPQTTGKDSGAVRLSEEGAPPLSPAATASPPPAPSDVEPDFVSTPAPLSPAPGPAVLAVLSPVKPAAPAVPERYVSLNFDNADIAVVIQTIAELLHMNYIVAPTVRGRITIQSSEKLPVSSLLPVLEQILEVNGFMAVKSGEFFKIVPANQAKQESVETVLQEQTPSVSTGLVTKIVQLRYISPGEAVKILTPFKTAAGIYQAHEPARLLFLTEVPAKIADLLKIIEVLDVDTFASIQVELYPVRYAGVEDLARELTQIVTQVFTSAGRGRSLFRIIPVPQVNSIMVFSGEAGLAANIREWIAKLDQPVSEANERIFVYPLSHATAETLAAVLEKVFNRDSTKTQTRSAAPAVAQPATRTVPAPRQPQAVQMPVTPPKAISSSGEGVASGGAAPVVVVADKDTNSLIIQTASWFYPTVVEMIRKLDTMPKQVLIEVLIAEITLDDTTQFGIQWALKGQGQVNAFGETHGVQTLTQNVYGGVAAAATGFSFFLTEAGRLTAALNAYAKDQKLNILSAPHIIATNNKEAKIDVGQEVPILKRTISDPNNTTASTSTNEIEYVSTGVILTVTPHINEGGYVTLDIDQEVSEAQTNITSGIDSPTIRKRTAKTTMVVKDNQTLVVGGLIYEKRDGSREGLPVLSKIPILGYLFGSTKSQVTKTELVLLISPRVVNTIEEGDLLTEQVKDRVLTLKKGIGQFGVKKKLEEFHPLQEKGQP